HKVPVGRDQVQHLEMARDMASSFNHRYGAHFTLPEVVIEESVATLPGTDGRKMSKSYDNTIPLFSSRAELKKLIAGIVTDSRLPGEAKEVEGSALFQIFQAFAGEEETASLRKAYADGIAWGDAKALVFERLDAEITPMRERYEALIADPAKIEAILLRGAAKARAIATPFMAGVRHAVGLRNLGSTDTGKKAKADAKAALPSFKQYREKDGRFAFKLVDPKGRLLLQSQGFASPKDAGAAIARLQQVGAPALPAFEGQVAAADGVSPDEIAAALQQLADAA
ncbi:MAG: tryptophan--tRNA ligase, partial [Rhodoferax sp.]|nr:tryptophan--tRNA ligase [Rhodoferax sp.]